MANRRSVLIGLGGLVAGGGALLGTGAFTTVEAERTVNVETAGDANAFLGLTPARSGGDFVDDNGDTISIDLDGTDAPNATGEGLNQRAVTVFRNLVTVANNGTQTVDILSLEMNVSNVDTSTVDGDPSSGDVESAFSFTVSDGNDDYDIASNPGDIVGGGNDENIDSLTSGSSVNFGINIDLLDSDITDLPTADYNLVITAETANTQ